MCLPFYSSWKMVCIKRFLSLMLSSNEIMVSVRKIPSISSIEKIISLVTVSKISRKYALAKFHLIDLALKGAKNPINEFIKKFRKNYPKYWSVLSKTI